ncbi:GDP-mannose dehydrogenase [Candidatus Bathyarchaeota archaeon]|nr:MAG: GDP-mannose dehydrogenase [Candidatus Bathyarchaeota archaeon]HDM88435.1 GDP-mannose dehydrogenase [Candidatus Bathyarchaeota archaeon]
MSMKSVLIIGLGEIGRPLYEIIVESGRFRVYGIDLDVEKIRMINAHAPKGKVDVMHICIPCYNRGDFIKSTLEYMNSFDPEITIINSTVPVGTTEEIGKRSCRHVAHSPVRGVHKSPEHMKLEIRRWTKYVGGVDDPSAELASKHFKEIGLKVKILRSSRETELAKLFETTYRAWMIVCFQEMHRISRRFHADFDEIVDFIEDTHRVRFDRPPMFPGVIGGHCLIPNVRLLLEAYKSDLLKLILRSNAMRKKEILDEDIREEVEKIRERVERLEKDLMRISKHAV